MNELQLRRVDDERLRRFTLGLLILLAITLRVAALAFTPDSLLHWPKHDPDAYGAFARSLARSGTFGPDPTNPVPSAHRPPGYPLLIAWCFAFEAPHLWWVVVVNVAAAAATVVGVYELTSRVVGGEPNLALVEEACCSSLAPTCSLPPQSGSLPPCGGGLGWGVSVSAGVSESVRAATSTPHPNPPPQGGRGQEGKGEQERDRSPREGEAPAEPRGLRPSTLPSPLAPAFAAFLVAFDPLLVHLSNQLMTETLFVALTTWTLVLWLRPNASPLLTGLLVGLAALTRPTAWPMWLAVGLATIATDRPRIATWLKASLIALLVCLPWGVRNWFALGRPIFTTTHGGYTAWLGQNPSFYASEVIGPDADWGRTKAFDEWTQENIVETRGMSERERDAWFAAKAKAWILEHPSEAIRSMMHHASSLWAVWPRTGPKKLRLPVAAFNLTLFALALAGLFALRRDKRTILTLLTVALAVTALHLGYWSNIRMRAPLEPLLAALAGASLMLRDAPVRRQRTE